MTDPPDMPYVSRGGLKLAAALDAFAIRPAGLVCADLGCSTGGFTDCLLRRGASRVYAVDTGYGVLDWTLRNDPGVVVLERTNALHVTLPEPVDLVTIDAGWTRQRHALPAAGRLLKPDGRVVTLIKPHYESDPATLRKTRGVLPDDRLNDTLAAALSDAEQAGFRVVATTRSPIRGGRGNAEFLAHLVRVPAVNGLWP